MHFLSHTKTLMLSALLSVVSVSSVMSMELLKASSVSSPEPVHLFSNHKDIFVEDENAAYRVASHNMNPLLNEVMKRKAMGKFVDEGAGYIRVKQLSDGKYALEAKVRGDGGGLLGTTIGCMSGKFIVHFTAQLAIGLATTGVTIVGGPAAGAAFFIAAEKATAPTIEAASNIAAIGLGIFGGAATGIV